MPGHGAVWRRFTAHGDLVASGPADAHVVLDAESGLVAFGDGWRGVVPQEDALVIAVARATLADEGNVRAGSVDRITGAAPTGATVRQPLDATGGAPRRDARRGTGPRGGSSAARRRAP